MTTLHAANSTRWLSFFNASGETIPSYGVFSIPLDTEAPTTELGRLKLIGKQYAPEDAGADPTTYLAFGGRYERVLALNGRTPVEAGRWGRCTFAFDGPAWARWRPEQDSAIPEDRLDPFLINSNTAYPVQIGPYPGTFGMSATGWGFRVLRVPGNDDGRVLVQQIPPEVPFQVKVISPWVTAIGARTQTGGNSGAPYSWCIGKVRNGMEQIVLGDNTPAAATPPHLACIAVLATMDVGAITDNRVITVQWRRGEFFAMAGGGHYFHNCSVVAGSTDGEPADVDLSFSLDDAVGDAANYTVAGYPSDPSFSIPNGTLCDVAYSVADRNFYIFGVHCP